jgi:antitoxin (DNA-binding transcriptional repressor) of toxin-antitoxin stability system
MTSSEAVMGKIVGIAEFKANCTRLISEMERNGEPILLTRRGKVVAELKPASAAKRKRMFGLMEGTITFAPDYDPSEPAYDGPWNAELGRWEPEP